MSYDLWVNSPEESIVSKKSLAAKMLTEGWEIRFLPTNAFLGDAPLVLLPSSGPLDRDVTLYGWRAEQTNSALLDQLFSQGDAKQLEKLFMDEDAFCGCSLSASKSSEKGVNTEYYFRLGGSSVVTSWEMTHAAWEAVGELSNGELVNPQEGIEDFDAQSPSLVSRTKAFISKLFKS